MHYFGLLLYYIIRLRETGVYTFSHLTLVTSQGSVRKPVRWCEYS